ncbi:NmrA/HSCARG family protein [Dysgonomonas sp. 521]|uniref:NmrA/HSCARG family protein n=1 Tax=Dysgonomonas sp. 521 TaxID=2302932 RepID=UPI0013D160AE|nr:NmrA/HSCARG family protein [Dysgonomonas sp. 521]NDV96608.1 NmrA/HSCARG family protein [Dysgonomonas sp. 521]
MALKTSPLILVIGGTGTQGGNVARELLKNGHRVRILTRNPESIAAKQMVEAGAEVVKGDMSDLQSLEPAMQDVTAIFSAQYADPNDPSIELRNASNMVQMAQKTGIQQIVHTSVVGSNVFPRWDKYKALVETFDHKYEVEEYIRNGGFKYWTILHPCWFMENFMQPNASVMAPELHKGVLFGRWEPETLIKLTCGEDTARFARAVFEDPEKFNKKDIDVSGDELTIVQIADVLSKAKKKQVTYEKVSYKEAVRRGMFEGTVAAHEWMNAVPGFDINETKQYGIRLKTFSEWVDENKDRIVID